MNPIYSRADAVAAHLNKWYIAGDYGYAIDGTAILDALASAKVTLSPDRFGRVRRLWRAIVDGEAG